MREIQSADRQGADAVIVTLENADEKTARHAVKQAVNSQQKPLGLTTIRVIGDGYKFTQTLRH
ncbi:hypothetical protein [Streptomyces sp. NPDC051219]|uniref:hypothetical protein n=1 Tax=Streptomyces sp. NPDC051219 TaxID=3155283 RepID=UPI00342D0EA4